MVTLTLVMLVCLARAGSAFRLKRLVHFQERCAKALKHVFDHVIGRMRALAHLGCQVTISQMVTELASS